MKTKDNSAIATMDLTDPRFPIWLGTFLASGVREIDRACDHIIKGFEGGLCNVKSRFAPDAYAVLGKKLTEETLTSWLLQKCLQGAGFQVQAEHYYPGTRQECDLVLYGRNKCSFWIEVKYAWKRWFNCNGTTGRSSNFKGYLLGDESHSGAAHDFRKLSRLLPTPASGVGMLLIGLDSIKAPMDVEIATLTAQESLPDNGWNLACHESWTDRRNEQFRINCWFWSRT
jgi:hypothetical protein